MAFKTSPAKQTTKAAKKVGKALSAFTTAADTLEIASAEHLAVAEKAYDDAARLDEIAEDNFEADLASAKRAYDAAYECALAARQLLFDEADALTALAEVNEDAAIAAQQNADSLRTLLAVA